MFMRKRNVRDFYIDEGNLRKNGIKKGSKVFQRRTIYPSFLILEFSLKVTLPAIRKTVADESSVVTNASW